MPSRIGNNTLCVYVCLLEVEMCRMHFLHQLFFFKYISYCVLFISMFPLLVVFIVFGFCWNIGTFTMNSSSSGCEKDVKNLLLLIEWAPICIVQQNV